MQDEIATHLINATKERSDGELRGLDDDKAAAFVVEQVKVYQEGMRIGCTAAVNIGRMLYFAKARMPYGTFRAWTEQRCKLKRSTVSHFMKLYELRKKHGVNPAKLSGRMLMALEKQPKLDKDEIRKAQEKGDKRSEAERTRSALELLADQIDHWLASDKDQFGKVLVPRMKAAIKQYGKTADRQKAVRE
jgi:hypothetical protein